MTARYSEIGDSRTNADGSVSTLVDNGDGTIGTLTTNCPKLPPLYLNHDTGTITATPQNGYVCFYDSRRWECRADSLYAAKLKAVAHFKPSKKKEHMVSVVLAEKGGEAVTHVAVD